MPGIVLVVLRKPAPARCVPDLHPAGRCPASLQACRAARLLADLLLALHCAGNVAATARLACLLCQSPAPRPGTGPEAQATTGRSAASRVERMLDRVQSLCSTLLAAQPCLPAKDAGEPHFKALAAAAALTARLVPPHFERIGTRTVLLVSALCQPGAAASRVAHGSEVAELLLSGTFEAIAVHATETMVADVDAVALPGASDNLCELSPAQACADGARDEPAPTPTKAGALQPSSWRFASSTILASVTAQSHGRSSVHSACCCCTGTSWRRARLWRRTPCAAGRSAACRPAHGRRRTPRVRRVLLASQDSDPSSRGEGAAADSPCLPLCARQVSRGASAR